MQQPNSTISQALNQALSQSMQNPAALVLASSLQQLGLPPGTVALQGPNGSIIWAAPQQSLQQIQQQQQLQQQAAQQNVNQANLNTLSQALSQQTPVLNPSSVMPMTINSQSLGQPAITQSLNQLRQSALQLQQTRNLQSLLQQAVNAQTLNQNVNSNTLSQALAQTLSQQLNQSLVQMPQTQQQHIDPTNVQATSPTSALLQLQTTLLQAAQAGNPQALLQLQSLQQLLVQQPNLTINQTINSSVTGAPLNLGSLNGHHALNSASTQPASSTLSHTGHQAVQALGAQSGNNNHNSTSNPSNNTLQSTSPSESQRLLPLPPFQINGNVLNGGGRSSPDSEQPPNHPAINQDGVIKPSDASAFKPRKRDRESNKTFKQEVRDVIRQNQAANASNEQSTDSNPANSSESSRSNNISNSDSSGSRSNNQSHSSDGSSDNEADDEEDARDENDQQSRRKKHQTHAGGASNTQLISPSHSDPVVHIPTVHPQATRPLSYMSNPHLHNQSVNHSMLTNPMFFSDSTLLSSDGISSRTLPFTQTGSSSQSSLVAPALMGSPALNQTVSQTLSMYPSLSTEPLTPHVFGLTPPTAQRSQTQQSNTQPTSQQLAQLANYITQLQQQHSQSLNLSAHPPNVTDPSLIGAIPQVMNTRAVTQPLGASSEVYNDDSQASPLSQLTTPVNASVAQANQEAQTGPGGKKMRKKHIVTDRQRRAKIKDGMEQLRSLLSIHGSFTTDQVSIMMSSVQLIQKLKSEVAVLKGHTAQIKSELDRYKATFGPLPAVPSKAATASSSNVASTSESGGSSEGNTTNTSSSDDSMTSAPAASSSPSPLSALSTLVALGLDSTALSNLNLESLNSLALLSALTESQASHDKGKASPLQGSMAALSMTRDGAVHNKHPRSGSETSENTPSPMLADQSSPDEGDSPDSTPDPVRMSLSNPNLSSTESSSAPMQT